MTEEPANLDFSFDNERTTAPSKTFLLGAILLALTMVVVLAVVSALLLLGGGNECDINCSSATQISSTNNIINAQIAATQSALSQITVTQSAFSQNASSITTVSERTQAQIPIPQQRIIIKDATLSLVVDDVTGKVADLTTLTESLGGWVVTSEVTAYTDYADREVTWGSITVRVPADRLTEVLDRAKRDVVSVLAENVTGQDVTQQYVDLQSRMENLEAAEEQLQQIMDNAVNTQDVLAVYNQLVDTRGQIEVIRGQLEYWSQAAAYSSLRVDLTPPPFEDEPEEDEAEKADSGWRPGATIERASTALIDTLQIMADGLIWLVVFFLPFALVGLVFVWLGYRLILRTGLLKK